MGERGLFRGYALNAIDAKSRVAIPAPFRKTIEANTNQLSFVIGKRGGDPCLVGFDIDWATLMQAELRGEQTKASETGQALSKNNSSRLAYSNTEDVAFDASGRFIMPKYFRTLGQIADWVLFLGTADDFEMWNPHVLIAAPGVDDEIKDLARFLLVERGIGL